MEVTGVLSNNIIAELATNTKGEQIQLQLSMAVLKQVQEQQKAQGDLILRLIEQSPAPGQPGNILNKTA
jgi:hypothetical protein